VKEACRVGLDLLAALDGMHSLGLLHATSLVTTSFATSISRNTPVG